MHDIGFTPPERRERPLARDARDRASASIDHGWRVPAVKWLMVQSLFTGGVGIYGFYALQPYLLELYGDPQAYLIAGLSAAIVAGRADPRRARGAAASARLFKRRTSRAAADRAALSVDHAAALMGLFEHFWAVIALTRRLGPAVRGDDADPPGLHERADPVAASARRSSPSTR